MTVNGSNSTLDAFPLRLRGRVREAGLDLFGHGLRPPTNTRLDTTRQRQRHRESTPPAVARAVRGRPAMTLGDLPDQGEAEAGAASLVRRPAALEWQQQGRPLAWSIGGLDAEGGQNPRTASAK